MYSDRPAGANSADQLNATAEVVSDQDLQC